jgi:hypothetical protein
MTYIQNSVLKKKYNYIFTGLNDQVKDFDITINNAFSMAAARYGGIYVNNAMSSQGVAAQNNAELEAKVSEKLSKAIRFQNNTATSNSREAQNAYKDAVASIESSKLPDDVKQRYTRLLNYSKPQGRLTANKALLRQGISNTGSLSQASFDAQSLAQPVTTNDNLKLKFVSDVDITSQTTAARYAKYTQSIKGKLRPIPITEQMHDKHIGQGFESDSNAGIQKLSSLFSVALHGSTNAAFAHVKLKIKGDPFWLYPKPTVPSQYTSLYVSVEHITDPIGWLKTSHLTAQSVNLAASDNFIVLRFRTPRIYDVEANPNVDDPYSEVAMFSGVFKVTQITNKFEEGVFYQELDCILDNEINLVNFVSQIEAANAVADVPTQANDLLQKTSLPPTAIKGSRIRSENTPVNPVGNTTTTNTSNIPTPLSGFGTI